MGHLDLIQLCRSRSQDVHTTNSNMMTLARKLWVADGMLGFYRGLLPNIIRVMPATCLTFVTYENLHRYLRTEEKGTT